MIKHVSLRGARWSRRSLCGAAGVVAGILLAAPASLAAQTPAPTASPEVTAEKPANGNTPAPDYTIGPDDILNVVFWREPDLSAEVVVRPDGRISLPLINDVMASGLTPAQLRELLTEQAKKFVTDPNVSVVVKQINSRKVFITGNVERPGPYTLSAGMTVLQLIALAGGLREFADSKKIVVMRTEGGRSTSLPFNYNEVSKRKNLQQNVELKRGDTVIVP